MKKIKLKDWDIKLGNYGKMLCKINKEDFNIIFDNFNKNIYDIKSFIFNLKKEEKHIIEFHKKIYGIELLSSPNLLINISLIYRFLTISHYSWLEKNLSKEKWYKNNDLILLWNKITNRSVLLSLKIDDDYSHWNRLVDSPMTGIFNINDELSKINAIWYAINYYEIDEINEFVDFLENIEIDVEFINEVNKNWFKNLSKEYKLLEFKNCFLYLKNVYNSNPEILKIVSILEEINMKFDINFFFSFISQNYNWNYMSKNEEKLSADLINWFQNFGTLDNIKFLHTEINDHFFFYNRIKLKSLNSSFLFNSYILDTCYYMYNNILKRIIDYDEEAFNLFVDVLFIFDLYITFDNENNFKRIKRFKTSLYDEFTEFMENMRNPNMMKKIFSELLPKLFNSNAYSNLEIKMRSKQILFIYENLLALNNSEMHIKTIKNNINIEHLLPQNDKQNNYKINKYMKNKVVNYIGNLFLIDININKELKNKSFNDKKVILKENTDFSIKEILDLEKWNDTAIKNRSKKIWNTIFNYIQADIKISQNSFIDNKNNKL